MHFDPDCKRCHRLANHLLALRASYPQYHCAPVQGIGPAFGARKAAMLIVGLAPGLHGANRTGIPFTGDHSGDLLFEGLFRVGIASRPSAAASRGAPPLKRARITNAVKCLPPQNRPTGDEIRQCNRYLQTELANLEPRAVILALGRVAHDAVLQSQGLAKSRFGFGHGRVHHFGDGLTLVDSFHPSRYNVNTGRLTVEDFVSVIELACDHSKPLRELMRARRGSNFAPNNMTT